LKLRMGLRDWAQRIARLHAHSNDELSKATAALARRPHLNRSESDGD
jgi:hypothetical protein